MKPRRNGRPSLRVGTSRNTTFRQPDDEYAQAYAKAHSQGMTVSEYIRSLIGKDLLLDRRASPRVTVQ